MSLLDDVRLAFECPLAWERLAGGDRRRFCDRCHKDVHNLSAMTREEAEDFLEANRDAPKCIRVEVDSERRALHRSKAPLVMAIGGAAAIAALMAWSHDTVPLDEVEGAFWTEQAPSIERPPLRAIRMLGGIRTEPGRMRVRTSGAER